MHLFHELWLSSCNLSNSLVNPPPRSNEVIPLSACADPRRDIATELCCNPGWDTSSNPADQYAQRFCVHHGERMTYNAAQLRCAASQKEQCSPRRYAGNPCNANVNYNRWHSWTASSCMTRAKVSYDIPGYIARVDYPDADYTGSRTVKDIVREDTKQFFQVAWLETASLPTDAQMCNSLQNCYSVEDGCICDTSVADTPVFVRASDISSKESVLSSLFVGGFDPTWYDNGEFTSLGNCNVAGIEFYTRSSSGDTCSSFSTETFFGLTDHHGIYRYMKNMQSIVSIVGVGATFRNVPHFINFVDQDLRDMYYETEAVIDHLFHHPSHAPYLAIRMIQRFGISNPSPGFIERVATAYKRGEHNGIGSGSYGNLGAL